MKIQRCAPDAMEKVFWKKHSLKKLLMNGESVEWIAKDTFEIRT